MSESNALAEKRAEFKAKQKKLAEAFEAAGRTLDFSNAKAMEILNAKDSTEAVEKVKAWNRELDSLSGELQAAELSEVKAAMDAREHARNTPIRNGEHPIPEDMKSRTFGDLVTKSKEYQGYDYRRDSAIGVQVKMPYGELLGLKTLMETGAGYAPESVRSGLVVPIATQRTTVLDIIPFAPVPQMVDKYMEQTTLTNNSAEKAEGVAYAESVFVYTERSSNVQKITNSLPITDEQLKFAPVVASLINTDLRRGLRERLETQVLVGDGNAPNLEGFLDAGKTGVQVQAKGVDPAFDAIFKAFVLIMTTGAANPDNVIMNPLNWQTIRLARTADGQYIMGNPAVVGPQALFGVPIVQSTRITSGTALAGDFSNYSYIGEPDGNSADVLVGYVGDQFKEGKRTLRCDLYACLTVKRQAAFCKITGLA
jgi:HK97 family phage major capsid protein